MNDQSATQRRDAFALYLVMTGAVSLFFTLIFTVNMIYQVTVVDLNPLQLVLVGTLLEVTIFVFEVPTGIVADVYSRRLSMLIGYVLMGAGFVVEGAVPQFGTVLAGQVLWGLGYTFTSGATQAWIADEVGDERAGQAFLRGAQVGSIGGLVGIPIGVGLGSLDIRLPILLGGALFIGLAGALALVMPERGFTPTPADERESWRTMAHTLRDGVQLVRGRAVLVTFAGVSVFYGLYSEGLDRLWTAHLLEDFTFPLVGHLKPVVWFGLINVAVLLLSAGGTEIVRRRVTVQQPGYVVRVLFAISAGMIAAILVFALAEPFGLAVLAVLSFKVLRSISEPLVSAWINPHIESGVRATVFSLMSQVDAISQVAGGPVLGVIGTRVSIRAAIVTSGFVLSPVLLLYGRVMRRDGRRAAPVPLDG